MKTKTEVQTQDALKKDDLSDLDLEFKALKEIFYALLPLAPRARGRVLRWVLTRLESEDATREEQTPERALGFAVDPAEDEVS